MEMLNNVFYMYSNMDNSSQILMFLIILVILMLLSIFIINIITKKRNEKYNMKFNPTYKYKEKKVKTIKEEPIKINVETPKKEVKKVEEVKEEPEVIEIVSSDNSIDKISQLLEDSLDNMDPIDLTVFEEDQEKNAIISYDELVKRAGAKKIVYKTEKATVNEVKKEEKIEIKDENKGKFKASKVISPIYGVQREKEKEEELDEFIDISNIPVSKDTKKDDEMQNDIEFLGNLKTFRRNLD